MDHILGTSEVPEEGGRKAFMPQDPHLQSPHWMLSPGLPEPKGKQCGHVRPGEWHPGVLPGAGILPLPGCGVWCSRVVDNSLLQEPEETRQSYFFTQAM